ncbi:hypothetical protein ACH41E_24615 [Streptomyces sp. NPDC020412]|uniref:hypothetical protein n=1 Tax=Streptomyces sp. NPDC020412 TaxID=3365073 RepID=UPI0037AEDD8D
MQRLREECRRNHGARPLVEAHRPQQDRAALAVVLLCREPDRLRLYLDTDTAPDVFAVDVRPSGALTALVAALPSLVTEQERFEADRTDPHVTQAVDLTYW